MVRNWMEACHLNCPKKGGGFVNFLILIGNPAKCPECGKIIKPDQGGQNQQIGKTGGLGMKNK